MTNAQRRLRAAAQTRIQKEHTTLLEHAIRQPESANTAIQTAFAHRRLLMNARIGTQKEHIIRLATAQAKGSAVILLIQTSHAACLRNALVVFALQPQCRLILLHQIQTSSKAHTKT